MKKRPHIILIVADQFRGDCIGKLGKRNVKTPYLDSLALQGELFTKAYAACPSCIPARRALFTGMYQAKHGMVGYQDGIEWAYDKMLPEVLADNGYGTVCIGKMHVHPPTKRCGFQEVKKHDGYIGYYRKPDIPYIQHQLVSDDYIKWLKDRRGIDADVCDGGLDSNCWITHPWSYDEEEHPTNWVSRESVKAIKNRDRDKPLFLMASYVRPHPPFDAPKAYYDLYNQGELDEPCSGDWVHKIKKPYDRGVYNSLYGCNDEEMTRQAVAGYYACITHLDHQIGRIIQALLVEGILEDSVIMFTSDHGEQLFEHGLFRKAWPYEGSIHIPLIIRAGNNMTETVKRCKINESLVELKDIMPTILAFADVEIPKSVDGESLYSSMPSQRQYIHGEHSLGDTSNQFIVTPRDKFIWYTQTGVEHYFNLEEDCNEEVDLINHPQYKERITYLRSCLIQVLENRKEGYSDGSKLIVGQKPCNYLF